jgi:hypothetical protein
MKSIRILITIISMMAVASCGNSTESTTTAPPAPAPAPAPEPASPRTHNNTGVQENPDHTEIGIDENGVKYSKKSGGNQTDVKIKTDSNSISIRKRK